jgi:hypothetical protein
MSIYTFSKKLKQDAEERHLVPRQEQRLVSRQKRHLVPQQEQRLVTRQKQRLVPRQ